MELGRRISRLVINIMYNLISVNLNWEQLYCTSNSPTKLPNHRFIDAVINLHFYRTISNHQISTQSIVHVGILNA